MNRRRVLGVLAGAVSVLVLSGCKEKADDVLGKGFPEIRYKLQAEVETPEGVKSGHSVIGVTWRHPGTLFGTQGSSGYTIKGEAAAVDLPNGELLFVLLRSETNEDWAAYLGRNIPVEMGDAPNSEDAENRYARLDSYYSRLAADHGVYPVERRRLINEKVESSEIDNYPYFVRFKDIDDPKSVELVDPDDLAATFGEGYALKSLTVQVTENRVSSGIESRLPKPPYVRSFIYDGEESLVLNLQKGKRVTQVFDRRDFVREISK